MTIFFGAVLFVSCESATKSRLSDQEATEDALAGADTDVTIPKCGNGTIEEGEVCEIGNTADCTTVTAGYKGTATCREDCSGWDATTCADINECTINPTICGAPDYASCTNTDGSFTCTCTNGYIPTSDKRLCIPRYDFEGPQYSGDLLLIVNEDADGNNQAFIGTLPSNLFTTAEQAQQPIPRSERFFFPRFGRIVPLPPGVTPTELTRRTYRAIEPTPDPEIGATRTFWAYNFNTGDRYQITAQAIYVGEYCILWAQVPVYVSASTAAAIGKEFDETLYPLITQTFYEASDVDGNGKITMLFLDAGGQAGGYFSPYELGDFEDSNKCDMIYIEQMTTIWGNGRYAMGIIAHEFTHLVHNNRDDLVEHNPNQQAWMMEGMSTSGEHIYRGFQSDYKSEYNSNESIANGMSVTYWEYTSPDVVGNYALTYLFHQYLRIHSGRGNAFYRELIEGEYNDYRDHDTIIKKYIDPNLDTAKMLTYFRIALIVNEPTGLYGFKKESGFSGFQKRYWNPSAGSEVYLRGGGALQIKITKPFTEPKDRDEGIRYIGIYTGATAPITREEYLGG